MKKALYLSMIVALFAAACSSNKNGFITKRKYTKGYFVDLKARNKNHVKEHETSVASKKHEVRNTLARTAATSVTESKNEHVVTAAVNKEVVQHPRAVKSVVTAVNEQKTGLLKKSEIKPAFAEKLAARQLERKMKKSQMADDLDDNTIILIILSLFPILALIAIYLKDGKKITLNFWVDLILHFLFLYWLFALLVVLDVINLA